MINQSADNMVSPHLLVATRRSWRLSGAWRTATERTGWWQCCQSQSEDAPRPSWWPDCERRIHLQRGRDARKRAYFLSWNKKMAQSIVRFFFCWPINSPVIKTRLMAQAMQSFLPARRLTSLSGPDVETVCWQNRSDHHRSPTSEAPSLSCEAESEHVSWSELVLKNKTAGFAAMK